jgi:excisionase family DNA binding protein
MTVLTIPDHQREYLSVAEVAAELSCSEPTVRRRIRAGELPAVQLGGHGSGVRIPRAGLEAWLWSGGEETRAQG